MVPSPANQQQRQYLRSLLSPQKNVGPDEQLPYDEDFMELMEQHLLGLMQDFPGLLIRTAPFFDNDGTTMPLLQADGTIPITFCRATYHIPVTIWLLQSYPITSPRVFVTPTHNMSIRRHHQHVDGSGLVVSLPYLDMWAFPDSNLADLARSLSNAFGLDPPLFSKLSTPPPTHAMGGLTSPVNDHKSSPNPNLRAPSSTSHSGNMPSSTTSQSNPRIPASPSTSSITHTSRQSDENSIDPSEVFRQNAIKALSERLKQGLEEQQKMHNADMRQLSVTESLLKSRHNRIMLAVDQQWQEREALEQALQLISTNINLVEEWLMSHANLQPQELDIDDAFVPITAHFKQMLDALATDLALDDVLYALDEAVKQGHITVDAYLRHVRAIAREQFYHRAISMKVEAIQRQVKISDMAARYAL